MTGSSAVTMPLAGTCITGRRSASNVVDVGLAIRHDDHLRGIQVIAHHLAQRLRRPVLAKIDFQALLLLGLGQHLPHLGENRQRRARRLGVVEKPLAANVADQHVRPPPQLQPGDQHDQQRQQQHRDADEHQNEVARGALPAIDEAQVVQHEHPERHRAPRRNRSATPAPIRTAAARCASRRGRPCRSTRMKPRSECARS